MREPSPKRPISLAPIGNKRPKLQWRKARVLIEVPVQIGVTDKEIIRWVNNAVDTYHRMDPIHDFIRPRKCGKPRIASYARWFAVRKNRELSELPEVFEEPEASEILQEPDVVGAVDIVVGKDDGVRDND